MNLNLEGKMQDQSERDFNVSMEISLSQVGVAHFIPYLIYHIWL